MTFLHLDVESRSAVDLKKSNAYVYFDDLSTDLWCAAYAFGDGEPELWFPGQPCPPRIAEHVTAGGLILAYNAAFERLAWRKLLGPKYGWPVPDLRQYRCVMAQAYAMALPGKLEHAAAALGIAEQKDLVGGRLMLKMSRPRAPRKNEPPGLYWHDDPGDVARLADYCAQDVRTEIAAYNRLPPLSAAEQETWFLDQEINDRGIYIDQPLCDAANRVIAETTKRLNDEMRRVTDGAVRGVSNTGELTAFLRYHGVDADSVAKDQVINLLVRDDLPAAVRRALELRQEGSKTSTAKINAMLARRQADGRMRGNLQYHGAGTGRWAARGAQLQNLPRPSIKAKHLPAVIADLMEADVDRIDMLHGPPLSVVSDCIRSMIAAPAGREIRAVDFSAIEARVTAWLAGQERKLDVFRAHDAKQGPDPYIVAAAGIYSVAPTAIGKDDPRRQTGKVSELSLGFQGGAGALAKMAKNYALDLASVYDTVYAAATPFNIDRAEEAWEERGKTSGMSQRKWMAAELIKLAWRADNPEVVDLWKTIDEAAVAATESPGRVIHAGEHLRYRRAGSWLFCRLPSGRVISYPYPRIEWTLTPWGSKKPTLIYKGVDSLSKKWGDHHFYGGLGTENAVQATARDIMRDAMHRVAPDALVLTVHDELVWEIEPSQSTIEDFCRLTSEPLPWAPELPIAVEGWAGSRYKK